MYILPVSDSSYWYYTIIVLNYHNIWGHDLDHWLLTSASFNSFTSSLIYRVEHRYDNMYVCMVTDRNVLTLLNCHLQIIKWESGFSIIQFLLNLLRRFLWGTGKGNLGNRQIYMNSCYYKKNSEKPKFIPSKD